MSATTDLLIEYSRHAGLSLTSLSQEKLALPMRALHRAVLQAFLDTGAPPSTRWLRDRARRLGLDADAALVELAAADLVHVGEDSVRVAYPFCGVPTNDRVDLDGYPPLWAMCAIDALGMMLMTRRDGVISSKDPEEGRPIRVQCRAARWDWTPRSAVVLVGVDQRCGCAAASACPHMAFHANAQRADAYLRAHPELTGFVLDHSQALEVAEFIFGPVLRGSQQT